MNRSSFHILRVGLAVTFLWIGTLIVMNPEAWGGYMTQWAIDLMPIPIKEAMVGTAILDAVIGILLLINRFVGVAALVGALHLIVILVITGITDITVRDIGILAGTLALLVNSVPENVIEKIIFWREKTPR